MSQRLLSLFAAVAISVTGSLGLWTNTSHADSSLNSASSSGPRSDPRLFAIGSLAASDMVTTYLMIGAMADHFSKGGYTVKQLQTILGGRIKNNRSIAKALRKVGAMPTVSEKAVIASFVDAYDALTHYAQATLDFAGNKSRSKLQAYNDARAQAKSAVQSATGGGK